MRTLLEIIVVALLIGLAWETSFKDHLREVPWIGDKMKPAKTVKSGQPRPSSTPTGAWMWDPNHRTALDTPIPQAKPAQPAPSVSGSWMWDPNRKGNLDPSRTSPSPH